MKIVMIHDIGFVDGGAEVLLLRTVETLRSHGHKVFILTSDTGTPTFADATFHADDATQVGKLKTYLYNPDAARSLAKVLDTFRPDVVHLHTITKASPSILRVLKRRRVPAVTTLHDYGLLYPRMYKVLPREQYCGLGDEACCARHAGFGRYYFELLRTGLHLHASRAVQAFVAPSHFVATIAASQGLEPVMALPNPAPDDDAVQERSPNPATILYAGRIEPEKGVRELVRSFVLVRQKIPGAKLVLVGGGSLLDKLKGARTAGVTFMGQRSFAELERQYQRAAVLAVPSLWPEPFGLIGPEAMRYGLPIVASGRGGMREWAIDGQTALLASPQDTQAFASALVHVLSDKKIQDTLSRGGRTKVRDFSLDVYTQGLEKTYDRARQAVKANSNINAI